MKNLRKGLLGLILAFICISSCTCSNLEEQERWIKMGQFDPDLNSPCIFAVGDSTYFAGYVYSDGNPPWKRNLGLGFDYHADIDICTEPTQDATLNSVGFYALKVEDTLLQHSPYKFLPEWSPAAEGCIVEF